MDQSQAASSTNLFNPTLFEYEPGKRYAWQVFDRITVATLTWNRLHFTKRFLDSVLRHSHLPYELLVIDNGSTDGTVEYLRGLAATLPHLTVIENGRNLGVARGLSQLRDRVKDGLIVYCDNDMEIVTNYWLLLIMKAFHALRVVRGSSDAALGPRVINLEEYGFRYAHRREVLRVPGEKGGLPRSSYAAGSKDDADPVAQLVEEVVIGWTGFLMGGAQFFPASVFQAIPFDECYPLHIGGTEAFTAATLERLGIPMGYIENGPIVRHNDWPYNEEKIRLYEKLTATRAVTDAKFVRWKLRSLLRRWRGS